MPTPRSPAAPPVPRRARLVRRLLLAGGALVLLAVLVGQFVLQPMRVSSGSMAPTLGVGDVVVVDRLHEAGWTPAPGAVVVARVPGEPEALVKRVAAVGGQVLEIRDGRLVVDGRRVREPYVVHARVDGTWFGPVDVPAGEVFLLGDNRSDSRDSRDFGTVQVGQVLGRVTGRLPFWH